MKLITYDQFEQNTPPWEFVRLGLATSSDYAKLLAKGKTTGKDSVQRDRLVHDTAHELIAQERADTWAGNRFTERGHAQEAEAFELYCDVRSLTPDMVRRPAFIKRTDLLTGCSPDALVSDDGGVEIKTMSGGLFLKLMTNPRVPPEHTAQLQGNLLVTGRSWWDLVIYSPPHAPYVVRVEPDRPYHAELTAALRKFNADVEAVLLKVRKETMTTFRARLDARLEEVIDEWDGHRAEAALKHADQMADLA